MPQLQLSTTYCEGGDNMLNVNLIPLYIKNATTGAFEKLNAILGPGLPAGGTDGDVLVKNGAGGYDTRWAASQLMPSTAIPIPSAGASASYDLPGLTAAHIVSAWNFTENGAAIAEDAAATRLTISTYAGYFVIINDGAASSAAIQPVFILPTTRAVAVH